MSLQAVSVALERAKETIYIEDWWLSPELVRGRGRHQRGRNTDESVLTSTAIFYTILETRPSAEASC